MDVFIYCIVLRHRFCTYGNTTQIIDFLFLARPTTGLRNRFRALMIRIYFLAYIELLVLSVATA